MESQIEIHEWIYIAFAVALIIILMTPYWKRSEHGFFLLALFLTAVFGYHIYTASTKISHPYTNMLGILSIYLLFMYVFTCKFLFQQSIFYPISYKKMKRDLYQRFGKRGSIIVLAEVPIIATACMIMSLILHQVVSSSMSFEFSTPENRTKFLNMADEYGHEYDFDEDGLIRIDKDCSEIEGFLIAYYEWDYDRLVSRGIEVLRQRTWADVCG